MWWRESVTTLAGVGAKRAADLAALGIRTLGDLLYFFPRQGSYLDYSQVKTIRELATDGSKQIFKARILRLNGMHHSRKSFMTVTLYDSTGYADLYLFAGQQYLIRKFRADDEVLIIGRVKAGRTAKMVSAETISAFDAQGTAPGILPVYPLSGALTQNVIRKLMHEALLLAQRELPESLPRGILEQYRFMPRLDALRNIHFPDSIDKLHRARTRFIFEELFLLQCGLLYYRLGTESLRAPKLARDGSGICTVLKGLPYMLTEAQKKAWEDISGDMEMTRPMHRILQGDVGSGKTVLAALTLVKATENGYQGCIMAPTEILARQHYATLSTYFAGANVRLALLVGGMKAKTRETLLADLAAGRIDVVVGTHALLQEDVVFADLAVVVTDEQHRFGVDQRAQLTDKAENGVHTLVMTATPIPRTLALTVYGDLDITRMEGRPPGRKTVQTLLYTDNERQAVYRGVRHQAELGHQVYVVCPLVEDSEEVKAHSAEQVFAEMKDTLLQGITVGVIHGRMKSQDKEKVMNDFVAGKIMVLFSTTVIEVGVNVPDATLMVVENAERFGLAQLHQLRGRVGRGTEQSYCALLMAGGDEMSRERLEILCKSDDGFYLAEQDLRLRGAGQLFGLRQHGLPDLHIADILHDTDVIVQARQRARECIDTEKSRAEIKQLVKMQLDERFQMIFNS